MMLSDTHSITLSIINYQIQALVYGLWCFMLYFKHHLLSLMVFKVPILVTNSECLSQSITKIQFKGQLFILFQKI
ncbi:MAG: hypothetical protein POELPBGB_00808 [Bacteroidia bacterium]|nr:hypothetical protein [Bacteroidia bacterium]